MSKPIKFLLLFSSWIFITGLLFEYVFSRPMYAAIQFVSALFVASYTALTIQYIIKLVTNK